MENINISELIKLAEQGDAQAEAELGFRYLLRQKGVEHDLSKALY